MADIGCDHGKLSVWLALSGVTPHVYAVDNRPMPLARAQALVQQTATGRLVSCRLGDGLQALAPMEAQDIIIAGMSGESIIAILAAAPWVRSTDVQLVLVPATRPDALRLWLYQNGFALGQELPVEERGRFYSVMSVQYTGVVQTPSALFCWLGLVPQTPGRAAEGYIRKYLGHLRKRQQAALPNEQKFELEQLIQEVEQCLP